MILLDGVPYFWSLWAYMFLLGYFMLSLSKSHLCHLTSKVKKNCLNVVNSRKYQKVRNHLLHMTKFTEKPDSKKILNIEKASCSWIIISWWLRCKNEFLKNNSIKNRIESLEKKIRQTIDRHSFNGNTHSEKYISILYLVLVLPYAHNFLPTFSCLRVFQVPT